jgi:hypothetical protein
MTRAQEALDRFAMGASILCLVHCLATPLLVVLVPVVAGTLLARESFHVVLLFWVLPTSCTALWIGCRRHKDRYVLLMVSVGLVVLVAAALWGNALVGEAGEKIATVVGSLAIVVGHWRSFRLCRCGNRADNCAWQHRAQHRVPES